jgi:hypothetical protein
MLTATVALATSASTAGASSVRVDPRDYFIATVNGSTGEIRPVTIFMACAGPISPGETGHPLAGQTVGVKRVLPPSSGTSALGYTGTSGTSIGAFFGAPPPTAPASSSYVSFDVYRAKPIPVTTVLPCSGTGQVTFVPLPLLPPAQTIAVPVRFVGQP